MIYTIVIYLTYFVLLCSGIWSIWHFRYLMPKFKVLAVYTWLSIIVQGISETLASQRINNLFLSHVYAVLSFVILTRFYCMLLRPFISDVLFKGQMISFVLLAIVNVIWWQPLTTFNSIPLTVEALVFIVFSLSTFILTLNEALNHHVRPFLRSLNWINSGIFLYFTGSLLLFYNGEIIIHVIMGKWSAYTMLLHTVLTMVLYICIGIGLWLSPKI
ncbi:MAG: hypothetical protein QM534_04315 [Sediminibacterium sp.]|nr:hypothetical protein [Sediminibacterium sp.]